ncbi:F-box and associated interaction domains-containing protein [Raphanus sativus]|uniref:F-box protein At3g57590 n=1 Tax=Raphanus sativus TaxID=3726 RepID=A0A6J0NTV1_RAPSA|nr:F-box protein At3g57590 [Raphanus sativus]KAJ4896144.1 F-box and associated interaction domains-containing protein [Raphanus sativus]
MNPFFTTDITTDIFARLPAKSAAKCRTLSKQWSSILSTPDFAERFLTHSSTRPRLLFAVERDGHWTFFISPQPQPSHSPVVTAEFHTKFAGDVSQYLCSYASGLILFPDMWVPGKSDDTNPVVCNPVTGKYATLPYLTIYRKSRAFLGFDPVGKQFKVMSEEYPFCSQRNHHQVLSLGEGGEELSWRVKDGPQYSHCLSEAIQIDGVLYYLADNFDDSTRVVVRFDVRSEEFEFIEADCFAGQEAVNLINYKGKLAGVNWKYVKGDDDDEKIVLELSLWVLEDVVEMKEWVKSVYVLSEEKIVRRCNFSVAGMTEGGEIVLAMDYTAKVYHVFFFDLEKNALRSVQVQGFGDKLEAIGTRGRVRVFVDYVEDLSVYDEKQLKSSILKERGESKPSSSAQVKVELVEGVSE